jgi:hypothetical protein
MSIDGVWIGDQFYWTLITNNLWLHFTNHYKTKINGLVTVMVFIVLLGSGFQQCSILSFHVQRPLSLLAGTFQVQLLSWTTWLPRQNWSYTATNSQLASLPWYQATIWDPQSVFLSLPWKLVLGIHIFFYYGAPCLTRRWSVIYSCCCWASLMQSFSGLNPTGLMTYFTVSILRLPPTLEGQAPVFTCITPGTGLAAICEPIV